MMPEAGIFSSPFTIGTGNSGMQRQAGSPKSRDVFAGRPATDHRR